MTVIQAIILGIVEGVTEFLPISSTGHLILTSKLFGIEDASFTKSFEIAIQFGAILAVVVLYWKGFWGHTEQYKKVLVAFLPTAIVGFLLYKILKQFLLSSSTIVLWSLLLGGVFLILFELWYSKKDGARHTEEISYKKSFLIGIFQSLAIIPGVSRSASTIVGGLFMGIKRQAIVEFSFLLAVPTILAASGLDLLKSNFYFNRSEIFTLIVGFILSFLSAVLGIKILTRATSKFSMTYFGVYRIILAIVFYVFFLR